MFILSQSNSVQNLSSLTLKTKQLWRGGKHPPPPVLHQPKKPGADRVKFQLIFLEKTDGELSKAEYFLKRNQYFCNIA